MPFYPEAGSVWIVMNICRNIRRKLSKYQDGELSAAQKNTIEAHLRSCKGCSRYLEDLAHVVQLFEVLPQIKPASMFSGQIIDRATRAEEPFWVRTLGGGFRLFPAPAAMAMLAIVGLLAGAALGNLLTEDRLYPSRSFSANYSSQSATLVSLSVFDAVPPGSLADGYFKMASRNPEHNHEM
jgi:anti-sigma factor RsiW